MEREHEQERYNGWTNFQTWAVNLWLDNEAPSRGYWREVAARCCHEVSDSTPVCDGDCTVKEAAAFMLAESLRREITLASPLGEPSMYSYLLRAALAEVDWQEIAAKWLSE